MSDETQAHRPTFVVTTEGYTPKGRWDQQPNLMNYKQAASYAARIIERTLKEAKEHDRPDLLDSLRITVWDMSFEAVELISGGKVMLADKDIARASGGEHQYIAAAMRNAMREEM